MKLLYLVIAILFVSQTVTAGEISTDRNNIAIRAYDTVAYHLENKALKGRSEFSLEWNGALWYFSSQKNKDLFSKNPEQYAPLFGGHCANGLSDSHSVNGNPEIWLIEDGQLLLFFSQQGRKAWISDPEAKRDKADDYWSLFEVN